MKQTEDVNLKECRLESLETTLLPEFLGGGIAD